MLIVHQKEGSYKQPWEPDMETSDTIIVSVLFKQAEDGSYSDIWEAMGFPRDRVVLHRSWEEETAREGMKGWRNTNLAKLIGKPLEGNFWGYSGSLPVPPCWETVTYYVLEEPLIVSHKQVEGILRVLQGSKVPNSQRPLQRDVSTGKNTLSVNTGKADDSCSKLEYPGSQATSVCWDCKPGAVKSPVNLMLDKAIKPEKPAVKGHDAPELTHYPTMAISKPGLYSREVVPVGDRSFGRLELGGRFYSAKYMTLHAVGVHTINGERYDGEIHVHYYLYGDWWETESHEGDHAESHRRLNSFRGDTHGPGDVAGGPSYQVIVAFPLKVTTLQLAGDFMKDLEAHGEQAGEKAYLSHDELKPIWEGDYLEYRGTMIYPPCDDTSTHWIFYTTPLKVSAQQLHTEWPSFSGFATTPPVVDRPDLQVHMNHIPASSLGTGKDCKTFGMDDWTYADADCWGEQYPNCSKSAQSPVNIITYGPETSVIRKAAHEKENFLNAAKYHPVNNTRVYQNGHTLQLIDAQNGVSHVGFGYLEIGGNFYFFQHLNLHCPAEHVIDGVQHACELQIVHQKQSHWGATAYDNDDILIASVFFDIAPSDEESPLLKQLYLPDLMDEKHVNQSWVRTLKHPLDISRALGPVLSGDYYRYAGSFTTPSCDEVVKWFVFKTSLPMSKAQWLAFKKVFPNPANARPVQHLNGRKVAFNSFEAPGEDFNVQTWEFYLDRFRGRNRNPPTPYIVLGGVIGGCVLGVLVMFATFVREDEKTSVQSAGGLTSEPVGRPSKPNQL